MIDNQTMVFPKTFKEFADMFSIKDIDEVYSNGIDFIPVFRVEQWLEHTMAIKALEEPCEDCISREKLIKDLNFLYNEDGFIKDTRARKTLEVIMGQAPVNLQEPCDNAISRQAVEKITWEEPSYTDALNVLTEVRDKVRALPSVNPQEPKTGQWVYKNGIRYCEFCGASNSTAYANYCPNCGAKMESEE